MTEEILKEHLRRYPEMEIQDAVKLLFQSHFGGGHMIQDARQSLERLKSEYASGNWKEGKEEELWTPAGKGMARVSLRVLEQGLSAETLNAMFVSSANTARGSREEFEKILRDFVLDCEEKRLPFSAEEARKYVEDYIRAGCPVVSHTERYRAAYRPSYRIVDRRYAEYLEVFLSADRLLAGKKDQITISIDGMCGSGKTSLARLLSGIYACNVFHMDDFFLRPEQRTEARLQEAGGNVDYERFREQILLHLKDRDGLSYQIYDCGQQRLTDWVKAGFCRLNILEGAYSGHPCFGEVSDLRVFLEISPQEQERRILERNGEFMLRRFQNEWIPMENRYFQAFQIRQKADLVLNRS